MVTKSSGPIADEELARGLLRDHLTNHAESGFDCKVNPQDPPDLIVTWNNGYAWR